MFTEHLVSCLTNITFYGLQNWKIDIILARYLCRYLLRMVTRQDEYRENGT